MRGTAAATVAVVILAYCGHLGFARAAAPARQWAAEAIRQLDLQSDLPRDRPAEKFDLFAHARIPPELLWLPVIGGLAVLVFYLGTLLPSWRGGRRPNWEGMPAATGDAAPRPAAEAAVAAEALARDGRFGEAMHLTLLGGVAALRERLGAEIADSLTSREILRSPRLSDAGRDCLGEMVGRVERSHFGRYPASRDDYLACRKAFDELMLALRREQAA